MSADDKPRRLSDEDQALWQSVTRSIMPLKRRRMRRETHEGSRAPGKPPPVLNSHPVPARPAPKAPPLMQIDRRLRQRLARGQIEIDARLDLHGRTLSEAHAALLRFLHRAQGDGAKIVLVITGKGGDTGSGRGALRRQVPLWLALPELRAHVLGVEEAHAAHGGSGALYVRLRRGR
jgi:DNA-nicking Smr family endonuclease